MSSLASEIKMQRNMRRITRMAVFAGVTILAVFIFTLYLVNRVFYDSYVAHVQAFVDKFAIAVNRQINGDLGALETITLFMKKDSKVETEVLKKTQFLNYFDAICYWGVNGEHQHFSLDGKWNESDFNKLNLEHQRAVRDAIGGRTVISAPFHSNVLNRDVLVYAAPVFSDDGKKVIAAVSVSKYLSSFSGLEERLDSNLKQIDLFLVNDKGIYFTIGQDPLTDDPVIDSIDSMTILSPTDKQSIVQALATHHTYYHTFYHDGIEYALSTSPLELKHWSIMSLDKPEIYRAPVFSAVKDLVSALSAVFFVSLLIGVVIYTMMRNNYRKQLAATYYDPVTGGYNLRKFLQRLEPRIQSKFPQTLVCFDIKDFRYINDYAGRENANALLRLVHETLSINQRVLLCCREQADHFFALLNLDDEAEINKCLNEIFTKVDSEYEKIFNLFPVIFYAGAVVMHGESLAELERRIRFMQREITPSYTHNVYFYDENTHLNELNYRNIETMMRPALKNHEFQIFLQPKCPPSSSMPTAAEALVRWIKPDGTMVMPSDFIPVFERNGFCVELDLYVLEEVCKQVRLWIDKGYSPLHVSVNQSKRLLFRPDYIYLVTKILNKYKIPPHTIVIEILETVLAKDIASLARFIQNLRASGLAVSMDDFGSGYSSLNKLSSLELDEIKFDKEFLLESDPDKKEKNKLILKHMFALIKMFNIRTVVEGVEDAEDVDFLKHESVDLAQGFYFSRPIPTNRFEELYLIRSKIV